jgi:hypothetical protein
MSTKITYDYIKKFAKTCGFDFGKTTGNKYFLTTPYTTYVRPTLKEIERKIIDDNRRFSTSRF